MSFNPYIDLTDAEFKMYYLIKEWRSITFNGANTSALPNEQYLMTRLDKSRAPVYRTLAGLKSKGIV